MQARRAVFATTLVIYEGKMLDNVAGAGLPSVWVWGSSRGTITNSVPVKYKTITLQADFQDSLKLC